MYHERASLQEWIELILPSSSSGGFHRPLFVLKDGRQMTKRECYVEAIAADPSNARSYQSLGNALSPSETIALKDGRQMSKKECRLTSRKCREQGQLD